MKVVSQDMRKQPQRPKRATLKDVAKLAGVSPTTVSFVINGKDARISVATADRVREAASELMYSPNSLIRALRFRRTETIGYCFPVRTSYLNVYVGAIFDGVHSGAEAAGYDLLIYRNRSENPIDIEASMFLDGRIDGLIYWPGAETPTLDRLAGASLPTVALLTTEVPDALGYCAVDEPQSADSAVEHLLGLGHERIAYVAAGTRLPHLAVRRDAFRTALAARGVDLWGVHEGRWSREVCAGVVEEWFDRWNRPTAICCAYDGMAFDLISELDNRGIRVPEHVSIISYEGIVPGTGQDGVSTLRQPVRAMGIWAAQSLADLIGGTDATDLRRAFPSELVGGRTTARAMRPETESVGVAR